jgi:hypothetical protein
MTKQVVVADLYWLRDSFVAELQKIKNSQGRWWFAVVLRPVRQMGIGNFPERGRVAADRERHIFAGYRKTQPKRAILNSGVDFNRDSVPDSLGNCLLGPRARSSNPIAIIFRGHALRAAKRSEYASNPIEYGETLLQHLIEAGLAS